MSVPQRVDELFEDTQQVLKIAQEVLIAAASHTDEAIRERDAEITRLRKRVCELEQQLYGEGVSMHSAVREAAGLTPAGSSR